MEEILDKNSEFISGTIRVSCINLFVRVKEIKEITDVAKRYLKEVLFEKISGTQKHTDFDTVKNEPNSLKWGRVKESEAVKYYEKVKNVEVVKPDFIINGNILGNCDGEITGAEGIIEVKCPYNPIIHLDNLKKKKVSYSENTQIQAYLWLYDKKYCDYISFDPRMPEKYRMKVIKVERDNDFIDQIKMSIGLAEKYMNNEFTVINNCL